MKSTSKLTCARLAGHVRPLSVNASLRDALQSRPKDLQYGSVHVCTGSWPRSLKASLRDAVESCSVNRSMAMARLTCARTAGHVPFNAPLRDAGKTHP